MYYWNMLLHICRWYFRCDNSIAIYLSISYLLYADKTNLWSLLGQIYLRFLFRTWVWTMFTGNKQWCYPRYLASKITLKKNPRIERLMNVLCKLWKRTINDWKLTSFYEEEFLFRLLLCLPNKLFFSNGLRT